MGWVEINLDFSGLLGIGYQEIMTDDSVHLLSTAARGSPCQSQEESSKDPID